MLYQYAWSHTHTHTHTTLVIQWPTSVVRLVVNVLWEKKKTVPPDSKPCSHLKWLQAHSEGQWRVTSSHSIHHSALIRTIKKKKFPPKLYRSRGETSLCFNQRRHKQKQKLLWCIIISNMDFLLQLLFNEEEVKHHWRKFVTVHYTQLDVRK